MSNDASRYFRYVVLIIFSVASVRSLVSNANEYTVHIDLTAG